MSELLDGITAEVSRDERAGDEHAAEARTRRLAARAARRVAQAHACSGPRCTNRNHRRDVRHALFMIDALNLQDVPPPTPGDYDDPVTFHSITRGEAARMR